LLDNYTFPQLFSYSTLPKVRQVRYEAKVQTYKSLRRK
jgi:hypothetical protein